jgi:hypothetical protein
MISLAATARADPTPRQFDLICNDGAPAASLDDVFRIDLAAGKWCNGACTELVELGVTPDTLTLRDEHNADIGQGMTADQVVTVDRHSGVLKVFVRTGSLTPEAIFHQCRVAPYTGATATPQF